MIKLLSCRINSITLAALLVALSSLISRFLGIFRDRILAGEFGAGETLDIYYAAFRIPDLIFNLLILGALSAGFVPIFTKLINKKTEKIKEKFFGKEHNEAWVLANNILNILGASLIVLSVFGMIFAPWIMKIIAPGFDAAQQVVSANLARIMFLSPLFLGVSGIFGGILQSYKRFFVYSLSPILYNVGIIIGALYFVPIWGVYGLAWGVAIGAFFHMAVQLPMVFSLGYRYLPIMDFKNKNVRRIGKLMVPRTLSLGISQINLLVITIIASTLGTGSLTVFNFANNLQSFPIGIFGISFAVAAFPTFSALANDKDKLIKHFSSVFRQILFFIVPSTVLLLTLRAQIIRVIFGTGAFDWADTTMTMDVLAFFSLSLFAQALLPLIVRIFYALEDSKTPFFVGFASSLVNVFLSLYLASKIGVAGLALAFSISTIINFMILWIVLRVRMGDLDEIKILVSVIKFSAAAVACGLTVQILKYNTAPFVDMERFWGIFVQGVSAGFFGIVVYMIFSALLASEEFYDFWHAIKRRLPFKKVTTGDQGEARGI